jgi:gliding motility-associated lipoprotein GldD
MKLKIYRLALFCGTLGLFACKPEVNMPKPRGYFKIDLPEKRAYQPFDSVGFPYTFEYPVYGKIDQDTAMIKEEGQPYWVNVNIPSLNAVIYLSYKTVLPGVSINSLVNESYKLTNAHQKKADFIDAPSITTPSGLNGVFYTVGGDAASTYQFYVTDNKKHFMRGSLYFNTLPNADSLAPAAAFLKTDLEHLINSLSFR